jgi:hypothetical protein
MNELLNKIGFFKDATCEPVPVGGNNRLWKVVSDGCSYAVKQYFRKEGGRDRLRSEEQFLAYADMLGITSVPAVIHREPDLDVMVLEWVEGSRVNAGEVTPGHVDQAMAFFTALQEGHSLGGSLPIGAEACFSVEHHLACADHRLHLLENIPQEEDADREAARLVQTDLIPVWRNVRARVESQVSVSALCSKCVSPSDFGFHNAIVRPSGELAFLDFEYAGWDDPAKMVCDFFCQPAVPVPFSHFEQVMDAVLPLFPEDVLLRKRIELLLPVYQLKWCAICLNEFLPERRQAREFAGRSLQKNEQLKKAAALVEKAGAAA